MQASDLNDVLKEIGLLLVAFAPLDVILEPTENLIHSGISAAIMAAGLLAMASTIRDDKRIPPTVRLGRWRGRELLRFRVTPM